MIFKNNATETIPFYSCKNCTCYFQLQLGIKLLPVVVS